jgi:DNA-binding HxlR family transcriptional regulator
MGVYKATGSDDMLSNNNSNLTNLIEGVVDVDPFFRKLLSLIQDRWALLILNRLTEDEGLGFAELKMRLGQISSKVLSRKLKDLENIRMINRIISEEKPLRVKYYLMADSKYFLEIILKFLIAVSSFSVDLKASK